MRILNNYKLYLENDSLSEEYKNNIIYLVNLLRFIESFTDEENKKINDSSSRMFVSEIIEYSKECNHMTEEVYEELIEFLKFITSDLKNGLLLDMIIEFFMDV